MCLKKLLSEAKYELSNAWDLIVKFSCCPESEVLDFPKVKGIKEIIDKLSEMDLDTNTYFDRSLLGKNHQKGFKFKKVSEYKNLGEWLDNVYIGQNENSSIRTKTHDEVFILDKRLGIKFSTMREMLPIAFIDEMRLSEKKAEEYLITFFFRY